MNRAIIFIMALSLPFLGSISAKADYFLWEDSDTGLTMTFPDTWKMQSNQGATDILTVSAPSDGDDPVCTIKASEDRRYMIYPPQYGDAIQREAVSIPFWKAYMGHYDEYTLNKVYDGGGLGRWLASYAMGSYSKHEGTVFQQRRALMFASLYHDTMYIVECSALNHGYDKWDNDFKSIVKSIDFKKMYHEKKTGDYRDFLKKADLYFWAQTGPEGTTNY